MTGEGRLVRDCMLDMVHRVTPYTRPVIGPDEWTDLLQDKLLEEVGEVIRAMNGRGDLLEELGDVMQVVIDIAALHEWSDNEVDATRLAKYRRKGGFGTVLAWRQPDE